MGILLQKSAVCSLCGVCLLKTKSFGIKYSIMDQVKFMGDSFTKCEGIWSA